jgi:hypothetical protein
MTEPVALSECPPRHRPPAQPPRAGHHRHLCPGDDLPDRPAGRARAGGALAGGAAVVAGRMGVPPHRAPPASWSRRRPRSPGHGGLLAVACAFATGPVTAAGSPPPPSCLSRRSPDLRGVRGLSPAAGPRARRRRRRARRPRPEAAGPGGGLTVCSFRRESVARDAAGGGSVCASACQHPRCLPLVSVPLPGGRRRPGARGLAAGWTRRFGSVAAVQRRLASGVSRGRTRSAHTLAPARPTTGAPGAISTWGQIHLMTTDQQSS